MKSHARSSVALLFAGGATLAEGGRAGTTVTKSGDIPAWIDQMAETEILADTEGFFISSGLDVIGLPEWQTIGRFIHEHYRRFDGFVVIHQAETLPLAAIALSCILPEIGKPVVLVGSSFLSPAERRAGRSIPQPVVSTEFGVRASFINAVQVAASDVGEVVAMHGSHVLRGASITSRQTADGRTIDGQILGKIDFGIRMYDQHRRRHTAMLRVRPNFETHVAVVEFVPGIDHTQLAAMTKSARGVIVSSAEGLGVLKAVLPVLHQSFGKEFPIVLFGPGRAKGLSLPSNMVISPYAWRTAAMLRFMWALGQSGRGRDWKTHFLAGSDLK